MRRAIRTEMGEVDVDHRIQEYESTSPIPREDFPERARQVIENQINAGKSDGEERLGGKRLQIEWLESGDVRLHATSYVGLVSLPGGLTIEIRPKVEGTDLLAMLQFALGIKAETTNEETRFKSGEKFIEALATIFESELYRVLNRGLHTAYQQTQGIEKRVRGRINVEQQLQRQGPQPTRFECSYHKLTKDTVLNQAVLFATDVLLQLVGKGRIGRALAQHKQQLQRRVELRRVRLVELEGVEISRLAGYYEDLYQLTRFVLSGLYIDELEAGGRAASSLLVNMNEIFESVVVESVRRAFAKEDVKVLSQARRHELFHTGGRTVSIRPDVAVLDDQETVFVGDAKWKIDTGRSRVPSNNDLYQLVGYQVAYDGPGILFYPEQGGDLGATYESELEEDLVVIEVPTSSNGRSYSATVVNRIVNTVFR